jgi:peptidyl-prolyl cis-trans isomerase SurA
MKIFLLIPVLAVAVGVPVLSRAEVADGVEAVVNDRAITYEEVELFTRPAVDALRREFASQPEVFQQKLKAALDDSLEQLVERELILHSFDTDGYKLAESYIDELVQDRIRDKFGDRVTMIKPLQAQGMTFEQFRKQIRERFIVDQLRLQNVQREIIVSPFKVENYYNTHLNDFQVEDQVKLRMIVLNKTSDDDTNTLSLAREIQGKIKGGAAFAEMASIYSQSSQQHPNGDWGWVERSVLRQELAAAAFALNPGQTSDVIETPDAIYLMLVEDKKNAHAKPLTDVRADIEKTLRSQQQAQLQKKWIDGLKKKTFVSYF